MFMEGVLTDEFALDNTPSFSCCSSTFGEVLQRFRISVSPSGAQCPRIDEIQLRESTDYDPVVEHPGAG